MNIEEFDTVKMKDGRTGSVCHVLEPGRAFLVDFPKPMEDEFGRRHGLMTFDTELVEIGDIAEKPE